MQPESCLPRKSKEDAIKYYKGQYWDSYLRAILEQLDSRFGKAQKGLFTLRALIPMHVDRAILGDTAAFLYRYYDIIQVT